MANQDTQDFYQGKCMTFICYFASPMKKSEGLAGAYAGFSEGGGAERRGGAAESGGGGRDPPKKLTIQTSARLS